MTNIEPRYRVVGDDKAIINGTVYSPGAEVDFAGWPKDPKLAPVNEPARRMTEYWRRFHKTPTLPDTPFNRLLGSIYLPAVLPPTAPETRNSEEGARLPSPVINGANDGMPRYRALYGQRVGKYHADVGMEFHFLGWPGDGMGPMNEPARLVSEYYDANRAHPELLPSPWCLFRQGLVLPTLPPVAKVA